MDTERTRGLQGVRLDTIRCRIPPGRLTPVDDDAVAVVYLM
jgi:hypothetical protein